MATYKRLLREKHFNHAQPVQVVTTLTLWGLTLVTKRGVGGECGERVEVVESVVRGWR